MFHVEHSGALGSFADTEVPKNPVEQVLRRDLSDNLAERIHRTAEVRRQKFLVQSLADRLRQVFQRLLGMEQRLFMSQVHQNWMPADRLSLKNGLVDCLS